MNKDLFEPISHILALRDLPVGISNRHVHIKQQDLEALFGKGSRLHVKKMLRQPGQYAAEETVSLRGPGGAVINNVRVLGPARTENQVELSITDGIKLGMAIPVRESGVLEGTPGITMVGPAGSVELEYGVIAAWMHVHLSIERAEFLGVCDKDIVMVETNGIRGCIFKNVLVRVHANYEPEMHIDTDEANACGLKNGDMVRILRK